MTDQVLPPRIEDLIFCDSIAQRLCGRPIRGDEDRPGFSLRVVVMPRDRHGPPQISLIVLPFASHIQSHQFARKHGAVQMIIPRSRKEWLRKHRVLSCHRPRPETRTMRQAITYLNAVVTEVTTDSTAVSNELSNFNINIYSYDGVTSPTCYPPQETPGPATCPSPFVPAQEFMSVTAVPEASPLAEYALYFLLGWGSVLLFRRRQISRADS